MSFSTNALLISLISEFFFQKNNIFGKNSTFVYSKQKYESSVWEFLFLFSIFVIQKVTFNENVSFADYESGIYLPDCSKLAIKRKNYIDVTTCWHDVIVNFFWGCNIPLVKFSYWSRFHVNIIPGSEVMKVYFYKGLIRNPEI